MTQSLRWRPQISGKSLPDDLKWILQKRYQIPHGEVYLDVDDVDDLAFLEGLKAADIDGSKELLDAISKHGSVIIWVE